MLFNMLLKFVTPNRNVQSRLQDCTSDKLQIFIPPKKICILFFTVYFNVAEPVWKLVLMFCKIYVD
jgi:hypothetical protein